MFRRKGKHFESGITSFFNWSCCEVIYFLWTTKQSYQVLSNNKTFFFLLAELGELSSFIFGIHIRKIYLKKSAMGFLNWFPSLSPQFFPKVKRLSPYKKYVEYLPCVIGFVHRLHIVEAVYSCKWAVSRSKGQKKPVILGEGWCIFLPNEELKNPRILNITG